MKIARMIATLGLGTLMSFPALAKDPKDFLSDAIMGDNSEIMLGRLAARAGGSAGVREFGRMLVADHTKAKREASAVARRLGLTPPTRAMVAADAEYAKLQVLSGRSFDREFVGYMVGDHRDDINAFEAEARADRGPAGVLAQKQLLTLRKHLDKAQSLNRVSMR
jgi:putative membrane protein